MNNYEFIIASLPLLQRDAPEVPDAEEVLSEIREQLSGRDAATLDLLLRLYAPDGLDAGLYSKAAGSGNRFIREFFALDLGVRNAKVEFLNRSLGRPEGTDIVSTDPEGTEQEFEYRAEVDAILAGSDILARERGIDDFYWKAVDAITVFDVFDLDVILAFVVKLKLAERWMKLDEQTGRELFRKLVKEIKENRTI